MTDAGPLRSFLLADLGTTVTHVALVERVDGLYRLTAVADSPTTIAAEEEDVTIGLERAVGKIEAVVQRRLWDEGGPVSPLTNTPDALSGVDAVVATCSVAPGLDTVVIGLTDRLSVESACRACEACNVRLKRALALDGQFRQWDEETLADLYRNPPDVIVLVGGADLGAAAPLESAAGTLVTLYEGMAPGRRPAVVFAGNVEARRPIARLMSSVFDLRVVDNVRPNVHVESLGELKRELSLLYEQVALPRVPGYSRLAEHLDSPLRSTFEALGATVRFLGCREPAGQGVLAVDAGSLATHMVAARGDAYQYSTCADMGTAYGLQGVLEHSGVQRLQAWMPCEISEEDVLARLHNARLRPHSIAQSDEDLLLLHAALRESISCAAERLWQQWRKEGEPPENCVSPPFDLIAARGGVLTKGESNALAALSLLDSLQPVGLTRLVLDWASIWPALSVLATIEPLAALQVLDRDAFLPLGTVIAPVGLPRKGGVALHVVMTREGGETSEIEIPFDVVMRIPLPVDEEAVIEVRPSRDYDLGLGRKGLGGRATIQGGGLGILFDTRGRPLRLPDDLRERRKKLAGWLANLESDGQ